MGKRSVGEIDSSKIITYAIVVGGGYFFIVKPLLVKLGILPSAQQVQQEQSSTTNISDYVNSALVKQTPTKSKGEWQIIANNIYNDLSKSGIADNKSDAGYQVARVQNDADFALLYDTFGKRQEYFFGIATGNLQDLVQFITGNLSKSDIATINDNYLRKGIKFRF
jgi:hypothetical protein